MNSNSQLTQTPYDALLAESDRTGWPVVFRTDLTEHDRATLTRRSPADSFAWVLSRHATYLVYPSRRPIDGAGHYAQDMPAICAQAFGRDNCRWYWWDGVRLLDVGSPEALGERLHEASAGDGS